MVIFHKDVDAEKTSEAIGQIRDHLRIKPEFKFSKCSDDVRTQFFARVSKHQFRVRAIVIEKARISSIYLRSEPERFYNFFLQNLMRHNETAIRNASIKIDGSGDRKFKNALSAYLRKQLTRGTIKKTEIRKLPQRQSDSISRHDGGSNRTVVSRPESQARRHLAENGETADRERVGVSIKKCPCGLAWRFPSKHALRRRFGSQGRWYQYFDGPSVVRQVSVMFVLLPISRGRL
jgi:hypothetical protein